MALNPKVRATRMTAAGVRKVTRVEHSAAPGVTDDTKVGYEVGSQWDVYDADNKYSKTYECTDATAGAAVWAEVLLLSASGSGVRRYALTKTIVLTGAASYDLDAALPIGACPIEGCINVDALAVCTTAVKLGLGTAADPDGYGKTAALTKNSKSLARIAGGALLGIPIVAAVTPRLSAVDINGAAAGTADTGTVSVKLVYEIAAFIADAA